MRRLWADGVARRGWTLLLLALTLFVAVHLLYSAWCAMTWFKFYMSDYGNYVNMLWNTANGHPFKLQVDWSYLRVHLSYTLALLSVFYHVWDHAFLLALLQWLMVVAGAVIVWTSTRKQGLEQPVAAALLFFFFGYIYTQRTLLSEFHGVSAYFLLYPWLYYAMSFRKNMAWLPWLLLLGVREDAFLFAAPILAYFAWRDHWREGWWWLAGGVLYGVFAMTILFPWITESSLWGRRPEAEVWATLAGLCAHPETMSRFVPGLIWTALPLLAVIRLPVLPAFLFPLVAYLTTVLSNDSYQNRLNMHYAAPTMVCLTMGLLESMARAHRQRGAAVRASLFWRSVALVALVLFAHVRRGFVAGGGRSCSAYCTLNDDGRAAFRASALVPREGTLVTEFNLGGFFGNRENIQTWTGWKADRHSRELVFSRLSNLARWDKGNVAAEFEAGDYGARLFNGTFVLLERGYHGPEDGFVRALHQRPDRLVVFQRTGYRAGENRYAPGATCVRYWKGKGRRAPLTIACGQGVTLPPGDWVAWIRYRAETPRLDVCGYWARLELYPLDGDTLLSGVEFDRVSTLPGHFRLQSIPFHLASEACVEPRVIGGDAALWLDRLVFVPAPVASAAARPSPLK